MKWITVEGIRDAETVAFAQRNLPSYTAMCRAGAAVAGRVERIAKRGGITRCVVLCGPGNNGGDGFVAARCLKEDGFDVCVYMTCVPSRLKGDALRAWKDLCAVGLRPQVLPSMEAWKDDPWADPAVSIRQAVVVDALLGIGAKGIPTGVLGAAIHWINGTAADSPVVSIDVPSGLDADSGCSPGETVRADATVTFSRPKIGFASPAARPFLGELIVADIGIPGDLLEAREVSPPEEIELIAEPELRHYLRPERVLDSHKRSYGHAFILGGSQAYPHAPVLSALAAYRAGCGLVTLDVPEESRAAAGYWVPEAVFTTATSDLNDLVSACDAVAIGPGMGPFDAVKMDILRALVSDVSIPRTVVDADALTALAALRQDGWSPDGSTLRLVLTPHPGEAARLLGVSVQEIQRDRAAAARAIAAAYHAIAVLKGHHTLVAEPGGRLHQCMGGNPGMATAGMGDILTGVIVGLLARGLGTEDAACLGVYHHAKAGDRAAFEHGQESLIASDLFKTLRL